VPAASWARPDWADLTTNMKKLSDEIEKSPLIAKEAPDASIRRFIDKWQRRMAGR
jgi:hypothetical protein